MCIERYISIQRSLISYRSGLRTGTEIYGVDENEYRNINWCTKGARFPISQGLRTAIEHRGNENDIEKINWHTKGA